MLTQTQSSTETTAAATTAKLARGVVRGIVGGHTSQPTTIDLSASYTNPVVVTTLIHSDTGLKWQPAAVVTSTSSTSFDLKVYDGWTRASYDVSYIVMEAGVYDFGNGMRFEAKAVDDVAAGGPKSRGVPGVEVIPGQQYQDPVVIGQVMSNETNDWSAFWASGSSYADAPGSKIYVGRQRMSQGQKSPLPETLGVMIFEAGVASGGGVQIDAGYTGKAVPYKNTAVHNQAVGFPAEHAVASAAGFAVSWKMAWPSLRGASFDSVLPNSSLPLTVDGAESKVASNTYNVAYVALADGGTTPPPPTGPVSDVQASRFLMQAGFGGNRAAVDAVKTAGFGNWIADQKTKSRSLTKDYMLSIADKNTPAPGPGVPFFRNDQYRYPMAINFTTIWARNIAYEDDQLRQKVTWALSQILVVSANSGGLDKAGAGLADFYDTLSKHAFGRYEDLLVDVSLHPVMAHYLTALNNRKADPSNRPGQQPDENYAREVMQLFSIGLWMLNDDGTPQLNPQGNKIPTYDNQDIQELAKVFTGIMVPHHKRTGKKIGSFINARNDLGEFLEPVVAFDESEHDTSAKTLFHLDPSLTVNLPAGLTGEVDIRNAITKLAQHPNVGPFIGRRLIQGLVKSNPSPEYISRVARVFNDNGSGQRGDMYAVVQAILLDDEARRAPVLIGDYPDGKFLEPIARIARLFRSMQPRKNTESGNHSMEDGGTLVNLPKSEFTFAFGEPHGEKFGQLPLHSPSVFNFYSPDYREGGADLHKLVTPEFQLATPATSIALGNSLRQMIIDRYTREVSYNIADQHVFDLRPLAALVGDPDAMLDEAEVLLTGGDLSPDTRQAAKALIVDLQSRGRHDYSVAIAVTYLICMSPDGAVIY